jgi:hypothetical protein
MFDSGINIIISQNTSNQNSSNEEINHSDMNEDDFTVKINTDSTRPEFKNYLFPSSPLFSDNKLDSDIWQPPEFIG